MTDSNKERAQAPYMPTFARLGRSVWFALESSQRSDPARAAGLEERLDAVGVQVQQVAAMGMSRMPVGEWSSRRLWGDEEWAAFLRTWQPHAASAFALLGDDDDVPPPRRKRNNWLPRFPFTGLITRIFRIVPTMLRKIKPLKWRAAASTSCSTRFRIAWGIRSKCVTRVESAPSDVDCFAAVVANACVTVRKTAKKWIGHAVVTSEPVFPFRRTPENWTNWFGVGTVSCGGKERIQKLPWTRRGRNMVSTSKTRRTLGVKLPPCLDLDCREKVYSVF